MSDSPMASNVTGAEPLGPVNLACFGEQVDATLRKGLEVEEGAYPRLPGGALKAIVVSTRGAEGGARPGGGPAPHRQGGRVWPGARNTGHNHQRSRRVLQSLRRQGGLAGALNPDLWPLGLQGIHFCHFQPPNLLPSVLWACSIAQTKPCSAPLHLWPPREGSVSESKASRSPRRVLNGLSPAPHSPEESLQPPAVLLLASPLLC